MVKNFRTLLTISGMLLYFIAIVIITTMHPLSYEEAKLIYITSLVIVTP